MLGLPVAVAGAVERAWSTARRARSAQRQATRTARTARHAVTATAHAPQEAAEWAVEGGRMPRPVKWAAVVMLLVYPFWLLGHEAAGVKVFNLPFSPTWGEVFGVGPSRDDVWEWANPGGGVVPAGWSPSQDEAAVFAAACPEAVPAGWFDRDDDGPDESWLVGTVRELGDAIRDKALDPETLQEYGAWWGDVVGVVVSAAVDDLTRATVPSPRVEAWEDRHGSCEPLQGVPGAPPATGTVPASTGQPGAWGGHSNGQIPSPALCPLQHARGHMLRCDAAAGFDRMAAAHLEDTGRPLRISDSYRTLAVQYDLVERKGLYSQGGLAARPGTSNHGWGLAVDVNVSGGTLAWLRAHGPSFGFREDTPRENWHWAWYGVGQQAG